MREETSTAAMTEEQQRVEEVAGSLSRASCERMMAGTDKGVVIVNAAIRRALTSRNLVLPLNAGKHNSLFDWTPLGAALRAHLRAKEPRP